MCLVARHLESIGLPTVCLASALDIVESGRAPRTVFVDFPLGHTAGAPFDPAGQRAAVAAALAALETVRTPGAIVRLAADWPDGDAWRAEATDPASGDQRQPRDTTPRWQHDADRLAAEAAAQDTGRA